MKFAAWIVAATFISGIGCGAAVGADTAVPQRSVSMHSAASRHVARLPRFVCNDYGRCWNSSLLKPEDYASGHLTLVNRVNRRAGYCVGYHSQYPVGWDDCLGDWDYGRGRIYH